MIFFSFGAFDIFCFLLLIYFHNKKKVKYQGRKKRAMNCCCPLALSVPGRPICSVSWSRRCGVMVLLTGPGVGNQGAHKAACGLEMLVSELLAYGLKCVILSPKHLF